MAPKDLDSLKFGLRSLTQMIWITTHDAPCWIAAMKPLLSHQAQAKVYQPFATDGLLPLKDYPVPSRHEGKEHVTPLTALQNVLGSAERSSTGIVFLPHVEWNDEIDLTLRQIQDRGTEDDGRWVKMLVFLNAGPPPAKYEDFVGLHIVDKGPTIDEVRVFMADIVQKLGVPADSESFVESMQGLSFRQIMTLVSQAVIMSKLPQGGSATLRVEDVRVLRTKMKGVYG